MPFTEINGTSGSFSTASGTVNYTVTTSVGTVDEHAAGYGDIDGTNYHIGDEAGNTNVTTFDFNAPIASISVKINASNNDEIFSFIIDGVPIDLPAMIASGDVTYTSQGNHSLDSTPNLNGTSINLADSTTLHFHTPMSKFEVGDNGGGGGSLMEVFVDQAALPGGGGPTPPCFTPGSWITTHRGMVLIETLQAGDLILTRDNGFQPLVWKYHRSLSASHLRARPQDRPVMLRKDSFGPNVPDRDMMVSPGHLVLLKTKGGYIGGEKEIFVPARQLVKNDRAFQASAMDTAYIHLLLEHHQVVLVDGMWSESFQPSFGSLHGLGPDRNEVFKIFPELEYQRGLDSYAPARSVAYRRDAGAALASLAGQYLQ